MKQTNMAPLAVKSEAGNDPTTEAAPATPSSSNKKPWESHPANAAALIGRHVLSKHHAFDDQPTEAEIISIKTSSTDDGVVYYYIHYLGHDRRLDHWVASSEVQPVPQLKRKRSLSLTDSQAMAFERQSSAELLEQRWLEFTKSILIGRHIIETWYFSPYPDQYTSDLSVLLLCENCLKYFKRKRALIKHMQQCPIEHPPGQEIYRDPDLRVSVFLVDGQQEKVYCQLLCLMAKLFLDHKTLYYAVEPFLFYVLTEYDDEGYHIRGYFSKEKHSDAMCNLSCLLILPPFQNDGWGRFLIQFSYVLSVMERKVGKPERPLSDLGQRCYLSYWKHTLLRYLINASNGEKASVTLNEIANKTGIHPHDLMLALESLKLLSRDPKSQDFVFSQNREELKRIFDMQRPPKVEVKGQLLRLSYTDSAVRKRRLEST